MIRRLLNLLTALSLLLCVAAAALWLRGQFHSDRLMWLRPWHNARGACYESFEAGSEYGRLFFAHRRSNGLHFIASPVYWAKEGDWGLHRMSWPRGDDTWRPAGFWDRQGFYGSGAWDRDKYKVSDSFSLPYWLPVAVFALLPGARVAARWRRTRRRTQGLCPACGYDLRATPDRCPECGADASVELST
jgi:hypothetical protein